MSTLVERLADAVERLAFKMPAPNEWTPQFVQLAVEARAAAALRATTGEGECQNTDALDEDRARDIRAALHTHDKDASRALDSLLADLHHQRDDNRRLYKMINTPPEPTTKARIQRGELAGVAEPLRKHGAVTKAAYFADGIKHFCRVVYWYANGNEVLRHTTFVECVHQKDAELLAELLSAATQPAEPLRDAGAVGYVDVDGPRELKEGRTGITLWATPMAPRIATPLYTHPAPAQPDEAAVERACIAYWNDEVEGRPHPNPWPKGAEPFVEDIRKGMRAALTAAAKEKE